MPTVSVVIPTYNRLHCLGRVLESLARQAGDLTALEVVVVSDGSTDGTDEYLARGELPLPVEVVLQENQGPAVARNAGVAAATGALVVFVDDDVVPGPGLVQQHVDAHRRCGDDVVVLGPMLNPPGYGMKPWVAWEQAMLYKQYDAMLAGRYRPTARQFYTGNASVLRRHLLDAGGFDPSFRRAEDVELAYRLARRGLRFVFQYDAIGYHYADRSYRSWISNAYAYGRNDVIFTYQRGEDWLLPTIRREFEVQQHPMLRKLVSTSLRHRGVGRLAAPVLRASASTASIVGATKVSRSALSGIYSLAYYEGVADGLGDRRSFLDLAPAP